MTPGPLERLLPTYAGWARGYYASWRGSTLVADIVTSRS